MNPRFHDAASSDAYIVWDARNDHVIPAVGAGEDPAECVYTRAAAEEMAAVAGPFWVRPASMRSRLEGRGAGR